ncbi:MAG: rod shape-determining protein MreD [Elusimicrobia bacterium GWA2_56_46]|nr:MAG: rod shape-determining protein MreD [Elusimicrobia bacterium GWA2_56_46]OGR54994.1 MAG: rod shape-determining protein MreD [Elusimicrobia bacterium GWC2_56_31]HBB67772.1 rod shape-determining protein MreD [Elusimicrobiota bacterium]HBW23996.1 rod shape-determining protein MreD [Elusimicrobiota bacterium]
MIIMGDILLYALTGIVYWWWTANLSVFGVAPNLIFIAALSAAIIARPAKALAYCFFFGLYLDFLGASLFGAYALIYTLMAYGIYMMKRHLDLVGSFSQVVAALILTPVIMFFYQGLSLTLGRINPLQLKGLLIEPFLNALLAPLMFHFFAQLKKRSGIL